MERSEITNEKIKHLLSVIKDKRLLFAIAPDELEMSAEEIFERYQSTQPKYPVMIYDIQGMLGRVARSGSIKIIQQEKDRVNTKIRFGVNIEKLNDYNDLLTHNLQQGCQVVQEIKYDKHSSKLKIGDDTIQITRNTNMSCLCDTVLASKETANKIWEREDLLVAMGKLTQVDIDEKETKPIPKKYRLTVYDSANDLNTKILVETGGKIMDFFDPASTLEVGVNKKYQNNVC